MTKKLEEANKLYDEWVENGNSDLQKDKKYAEWYDKDLNRIIEMKHCYDTAIEAEKKQAVEEAMKKKIGYIDNKIKEIENKITEYHNNNDNYSVTEAEVDIGLYEKVKEILLKEV